MWMRWLSVCLFRSLGVCFPIAVWCCTPCLCLWVLMWIDSSIVDNAACFLCTPLLPSVKEISFKCVNQPGPWRAQGAFVLELGFLKFSTHRPDQTPQSTHSHFRQHCSSSTRDRRSPGPIKATCHISYCRHVFRAVDIWVQNEQLLKSPLIYCCDEQYRLIEHYKRSGDACRKDKRDTTVIKLIWIWGWIWIWQQCNAASCADT